MAPFEISQTTARSKAAYHRPSPVDPIVSYVPLEKGPLTPKKQQSELIEGPTKAFHKNSHQLLIEHALSDQSPSSDDTVDRRRSLPERDPKKSRVQFDFSLSTYHEECNLLQKSSSPIDDNDISWFDPDPPTQLPSSNRPPEYYIPTGAKKKHRPFSANNASDAALEYRRILEDLDHSLTPSPCKDTSSDDTDSHESKCNDMNRPAENTVLEHYSLEPNDATRRSRRHSESTARESDASFPALETTPVDLKVLKEIWADRKRTAMGVKRPDRTSANSARRDKIIASTTRSIEDEENQTSVRASGPHEEGCDSTLREPENYINMKPKIQEPQQEQRQLKGILKSNASALAPISLPPSSGLYLHALSGSRSQQHLPLNNRMIDPSPYSVRKEKRLNTGHNDPRRQYRRSNGHIRSGPQKRVSIHGADVRSGYCPLKAEISSIAPRVEHFSLPYRSRSLDIRRPSQMTDHEHVPSLRSRPSRSSLRPSQRQRAFSLSPRPLPPIPSDPAEQPILRSDPVKVRRSDSIRSTRSATSVKPPKPRQPPIRPALSPQETLAALIAPAPLPEPRMTPECRALLAAQQKEVEEKFRREAVAADRAIRISQYRKNAKSKHGSGTATPDNGESSRTAGLLTSDVHASADGMRDIDQVGPGWSAEDVRLLREREKVMRWKAEREKLVFERERGLEGDDDEGRKDGGGRKKRVWGCGLF